MSFIAIVTDSKSEDELKKVIDSYMIKDADLMYIKEKNLENIKNIKLETIVINIKITEKELVEKIVNNAKYLIINSDYNDVKDYNFNVEQIITYGFNSKCDITVSSREEEKSLLYLQKNIKSIFDKNVEMQEIKANVPFSTNIYNIMIIIALTLFYAK